MMILLNKDLSKELCIVAEISCNHEGSKQQAFDLIKAAKDAGADAVKIQAYTADELTINSARSDFIVKSGPWKDRVLYDLYTKTATPLEWLPELFNCAKDYSIPMFSSVFGIQSLAALEVVGCPAYKIASFEANDLELIKMVAPTKKPMIVSTGILPNMGDELDKILNIKDDVIFMHCVSEYPAKISNMEFNRLKYSYSDYSGFSDHTLGYEAAQIAVAIGARIIEKHLCLSHTSEDVQFSFNPTQFKLYVERCKYTFESMKTDYTKERLGSEFKRSLYVVKPIKQGEQFTRENIRSIRPGYGLPPSELENILSYRATCDLEIGTAMKMEYVAWQMKN